MASAAQNAGVGPMAVSPAQSHMKESQRWLRAVHILGLLTMAAISHWSVTGMSVSASMREFHPCQIELRLLFPRRTPFWGSAHHRQQSVLPFPLVLQMPYASLQPIPALPMHGLRAICNQIRGGDRSVLDRLNKTEVTGVLAIIGDTMITWGDLPPIVPAVVDEQLISAGDRL